jgi:hypothetical protein
MKESTSEASGQRQTDMLNKSGGKRRANEAHAPRRFTSQQSAHSTADTHMNESSVATDGQMGNSGLSGSATARVDDSEAMSIDTSSDIGGSTGVAGAQGTWFRDD